MIDQLRLLERNTGRQPATHCLACNALTQFGKDYCFEHVGENDYVKELQSRITRRQAELDAVAAHGAQAVDLDGIVTREILGLLLAHGACCVGRLGRETAIDFKLFLCFVRRLRSAGLIRQALPPRRSRGHGMVCLSEASELRMSDAS